MQRTREHNKLGPIADTYDTLQGIPFIDLAFDAKRVRELPWQRVYRRTLLQCVEMLLLNCEELCNQQLNSDDDVFVTSVNCSNWQLQLLRYAVELADAATAVAQPGASHPLPLRTAERYLATYARVCEANSRALRDPAILDSATVLEYSNQYAALMQNLKNVYVYIGMLMVRLEALRIAADDEPCVDATSPGSPLCRAFAGDIVNSEDRMALKGNTLFSQFRVLHQVPELLARAAQAILQLHIATSESMAEVVQPLSALSSLYRLVTRAITPMSLLMVPAEYHLIRANLGQTSGSKSATLRPLFLKANIQELHSMVARLKAGSPEGLAALADDLVREVTLCAVEWRELHLSFPRNVLGGFGTKSLIGSPDAVEVPEGWKRESLAEHPLNILGIADAPRRTEIPAAITGLDDLLRRSTAAKTIGNFRDVQERKGYFERKR